MKFLLAKSKIIIFLSVEANKLFIVSPSQAKAYSFYLPSFFHYNKQATHHIKLFFTSNFSYSSFLAHLLVFTSKFSRIFFLKLKIKGLGYRIRRYTKALYRFYFTRTNYIYFNVPLYLVFRRRKKRLLLMSPDYALVRLVFTHLMLLHTIGPYNRKGFSYPREIVFLKPKKKIV